MSVTIPNINRKSVHVPLHDAVHQARKSARQSRQSKSIMSRYSSTGHLLNPYTKPGERTHLPTYQLYTKTPILAEKLHNTIERSIRMSVANSAMDYYQEKRSNKFTQSMAHSMMDNVRHGELDRFRIVAWVTLMERKNQSGMAKMGFCWDTEQDQWGKYVFENQHIVITAFVGLVYFE